MADAEPIPVAVHDIVQDPMPKQLKPDEDVEIADAVARQMMLVAKFTLDGFQSSKGFDDERRAMLLSMALSGVVLLPLTDDREPSETREKISLNAILSLAQIAVRHNWLEFAEMPQPGNA